MKPWDTGDGCNHTLTPQPLLLPRTGHTFSMLPPDHETGIPQSAMKRSLCFRRRGMEEPFIWPGRGYLIDTSHQMMTPTRWSRQQLVASFLRNVSSLPEPGQLRTAGRCRRRYFSSCHGIRNYSPDAKDEAKVRGMCSKWTTKDSGQGCGSHQKWRLTGNPSTTICWVIIIFRPKVDWVLGYPILIKIIDPSFLSEHINRLRNHAIGQWTYMIYYRIPQFPSHR
jgi:hypothetical protein